MSSFFGVIILQICFSPDAFPHRLPEEHLAPLHKCFLRAKGYHCHFCGLLLAVFLWKTLLSLQTIIFSPQPSTASCHLLSPFCSLCCTKLGWVVVCRRGVGMGEVGLSGELHGGSCQVKEYGLGMRTAKCVKEPRNYSEHCQAPQHCLTLFCISEFVLNPWTLRRFGIRSTVTVEMHTSSFLASLPSCFLKQMSPSQKIFMTFLRSWV